MQALSPTVFPCYAPGDLPTAEAIRAFLEHGTEVRVFLEEGVLRPGEDLIGKAREAGMADMALVLFSHQSLPQPWSRTQWEDALVKEPAESGLRIAFVRCDDCVPPRILSPRFELAGHPVAGLRAVKRWVRGQMAGYIAPPTPRWRGPEVDVERLALAVADRAGTATIASLGLALEFVRACLGDFDEVFVLDCGRRSLPALAGDLTAQLGLRLVGDVGSNLAQLQEFCRARRFLILLAGAGDPAPHELMFGGNCSTLMVREGGLDAPTDPLREVQGVLAQGTCQGNWNEFCTQARLGRRLTQEQGRIAECFELMGQWHSAARARDDLRVMEESARELAWILESWDRTREAAELQQGRRGQIREQIPLPFPTEPDLLR